MSSTALKNSCTEIVKEIDHWGSNNSISTTFKEQLFGAFSFHQKLK